MSLAKSSIQVPWRYDAVSLLGDGDSNDGRARSVSSAVLRSNSCDEGSGKDGETHFDRCRLLGRLILSKKIGYQEDGWLRKVDCCWL